MSRHILLRIADAPSSHLRYGALKGVYQRSRQRPVRRPAKVHHPEAENQPYSCCIILGVPGRLVVETLWLMV